MSSEKEIIDLTRLPPPTIVEPWSYEQIRADMIEDFKARLEERGESYNFSPADPAIKVIETNAYSESRLRQRFNDNVREVLLAYSTGDNLEQLTAFWGVERKKVEGTDVEESDRVVRNKALLAVDQRSTAGNAPSYKFHAIEAGEGSLIDVHAHSPRPGESEVVLLFDPELSLSDVAPYLKSVIARIEEKRALTDKVAVRLAEAAEFSLKVRLHVGVGVDPQLVKDEALRSLADFLQVPFGKPVLLPADEGIKKAPYAIAKNLYISALHAALTVETVFRVEVLSPEADIVFGSDEQHKNIVLSFDPKKDIEVGPPFSEPRGGEDG